jgi:hypothetical protein
MPPVVRKRPWYLTAALLGALVLGSEGAREGWQTFVNYQVAVDPSEIGAGIADEADRLALIARFQSMLQVLDAAKPRVWPLAAAALVLGAATFVYAMRVLAGNGAARGMLLQLIVAQAGVSAAGYWLERDVVQADFEVEEARLIANLPHDPGVRADAARKAALVRAASPPIGFALSALCRVLIIVGLTRRRSSEFLEGGPAALRER